jgi:hypothetical protein
MKKILFLTIIVCVIIFTSCSENNVNIEPGYIAKLLAPTGYVGKIIPAG